MSEQRIADRFTLQQSWWIASEMTRRHPEILISRVDVEDLGPLLIANDRRSDVQILFHAEGGIRITTATGENTALPWNTVFSFQNAHKAVKLMEIATDLGQPVTSPETTERTIVYRLIARWLTRELDGRHTWEALPVANPGLSATKAERNAQRLLSPFPSAVRAAQDRTVNEHGGHSVRITDHGYEPMWYFLRDSEPIFVLDDAGFAHLQSDAQIDLLRLYRVFGHRIDAVVDVLSASPPRVIEIAKQHDALVEPGPDFRIGLAPNGGVAVMTKEAFERWMSEAESVASASAASTPAAGSSVDAPETPEVPVYRSDDTRAVTHDNGRLRLSNAQRDRAIGTMIGSAAGDARGSQYEFGTAIPQTTELEFGIGAFGHEVGEWTDDTSMAMPILDALARNESLNDAKTLGKIVQEWKTWARHSKDVGAQTHTILSAVGAHATEADARTASEELHARSGRSAGNGSLMRTSPIALGYLAEGREPALIDASSRIAQLTHWEEDNIDACALWNLAIRHAILHGELNLHDQLQWLPESRRDKWRGLIGEALSPDKNPVDFAHKNGWVVLAFQAALSAVAQSSNAADAIDRAIRGGGDTDTVAAIAGALAGARYGSTSVPVDWQVKLHGYPGIDAAELARRSVRAFAGADDQGWPNSARQDPVGYVDYIAQHPHDDGLWIGSLAGLDRLTDVVPEVSAVVSLCRVGTEQVPEGMKSVQVRLIDSSDANPQLDTTLRSTAMAIADLRAAGHKVYLHCVEGRSRTPSVAALYSALHRGVPVQDAFADIERAIPVFGPQRFLVSAVERIAADR
ncbi:ADP-ribosylglycohydrolase family protein [Gulosibacter molinativorax]|uniref:T3SS peptide-binding chaperone domain-containing protein n=1 Tax=Gulosibacter molinativorax TaxID=256821 RepID=A0ABT7CAG1_9MICO|nr:ADP-ribosylglycohydrolase family protein [Gulosibacter molinativorax]MDJ1372201.1 hypothetical protein [Gulosibacter molinativorax]QUY60927.1 ADP-ribosylation/Crystallin J1 [Gulosibacter molinativorax]